MAKRRIVRMGRKALSMLLVFTMITGMLQMSAFAATYPDQTMDGFYTVDAQGNAALTEDTVVEQDGFTLSKTIEQVGLNQFEITLEVVTSQTVTTNDAAIQLVVDTSSSMQYCATCGKHKGNGFGQPCTERTHTQNRLEAIQEILTKENGFLDSLAAANTGKLYVSVVRYGLNATVVSDWKDIKNAGNLAAVKADIGRLTANENGTNTHAGLMLANNRLDMPVVANAGAKFTVLFSDGFANCVGVESSSTTNIQLSGWGPSNADATTPGTNGAKEQAQDAAEKSTVYAVGYGVDKEYLSKIVGSENNVFVGADSASVSQAFAHIADSATSGMNGAGTSVTDPMGDGGEYVMGQFIILGDVSDLSDEGVSSTGSAISWNLDPANAEVSESADGQTVTYTYSITYPITLNTAAKGFEEFNEDGSVKYYPTNGYTYLSVPATKDSEAKDIPFLVPGVCGTIPEVEWTVEYYLQDEAAVGDLDNYTLDKSERQGRVDVWTTVDAPEGYQTEYRNDDYQFESGDVKLEITPNGENVMKLYYKHITSSVVVNHFYKTDVILPDGTEEPGTYPETPDKSYDYIRKINTEFEAVPETGYNQGQYELVDSDPISGEITVSLDAESNVINLYYSREVDQRAITSAQVNHVYTTYGYELQDGEYVLVQKGEPIYEPAEQAAVIRATTVFNVSDQPLEGYSEFELNPDLGEYAQLAEDGMSFVVSEKAADNVRTLYFETVVDDRIPVSVTVNHYYTKTVTSVVDGQVVTTVEPDGDLGGSYFYSAYEGERFQAEEINEYLGDLYLSDSGNADKLVIEELSAEGASIDLYYNLTVVPEQTSLLVNHYWRTFTEVTVELTEEVEEEIVTEITEEVTDPETGEVSTVTSTVTETVTKTVVVGTTTEIREIEDHSVEEIEVDGLYEGQEYTAPKLSWGEGYSFNEEESNDTGIAGEDYVLNLYYDKWNDADEREDAGIDVQHVYTTYLETIVDGEVQILTVGDGTVTEDYTEYLAGDEFIAAEQPVYNGNDYVCITEITPVILQPGTNATVVIHYERSISDLVETDYSVNYEYRTYTMTVDENGVAGYYEAPAVEYGEPVGGHGYVGQEVSFGDGAREGFAPLATNPATEQTLDEEGNDWTFVYEQYIPLEKGSVVVNHYYTLETVAIDGTSSWTTSTVTGAAVDKYLGESYTAVPVLNGYDKMDAVLDAGPFAAPYTFSVSGDHVVDFHYKKVIDNSVEAPYSITHKYYLYDWDGSLISGPAEDPEPATTGVGYVTTTISAAPEFSDYTLTDATYNGSDLGELEGSAYVITLQEGRNDVVFVYEKTLNRDLLDVTVIHNYYQDEAAVVGGAEPLSKYHETASEIPEGESYTAQLRNVEGYTFYSAEPESMTVRVTDDADFVIILNYVRSEASYQVVHVYNTNGVEDGSTSQLLGGLHGDLIVAGDVPQVPTYNGKNYTFTSVSEDITLDANEIKTITLVYNRVVMVPPPSPDPDPTYYTLTVNWVDEDGNALADTLEETKREGSSYTTEQKEFEGYTFVAATGDATSGRMNGDKSVTYVYAPAEESIEIEEPEVPLGELPEDGGEGEALEELLDEEVPLAGVPKTGDPMTLYAAVTALSGMGLAVLNLTGKKKEDEE